MDRNLEMTDVSEFAWLSWLLVTFNVLLTLEIPRRKICVSE